MRKHYLTDKIKFYRHQNTQLKVSFKYEYFASTYLNEVVKVWMMPITEIWNTVLGRGSEISNRKDDHLNKFQS